MQLIKINALGGISVAYNADKEEQKEIGLVKKNNRGEYIRVTRIIPKDKNKLESLDIRLMYTADDDTVRPTVRGVRINSEILPEVIALILKGMSQEEREELRELVGDGLFTGSGREDVFIDDGEEDGEINFFEEDDQ